MRLGCRSPVLSVCSFQSGYVTSVSVSCLLSSGFKSAVVSLSLPGHSTVPRHSCDFCDPVPPPLTVPSLNSLQPLFRAERHVSCLLTHLVHLTVSILSYPWLPFPGFCCLQKPPSKSTSWKIPERKNLVLLEWCGEAVPYPLIQGMGHALCSVSTWYTLPVPWEPGSQRGYQIHQLPW